MISGVNVPKLASKEHKLACTKTCVGQCIHYFIFTHLVYLPHYLNLSFFFSLFLHFFLNLFIFLIFLSVSVSHSFLLFHAYHLTFSPLTLFVKIVPKIFSNLSTRISKTLRVLTCPIGRTRKATVKNESISSIQRSREPSIFQKFIEIVRLHNNTNSRIVSCYFVLFYFIEIWPTEVLLCLTFLHWSTHSQSDFFYFIDFVFFLSFNNLLSVAIFLVMITISRCHERSLNYWLFVWNDVSTPQNHFFANF